MNLLTTRQQIKTHLEAAPALAGIPVFLERTGVNIDGPVAAALSSAGLALVVMSADTATSDQSGRPGRAVLSVQVRILLIESPATATQTGEELAPAIISALIGKTVGNHSIELASDAYDRAVDDSGDLFHALTFRIPLTIQGT